jgi:hypothetical protein
MSQRLPSLPNLGHLKKQAKDVLSVLRQRSPRCPLSDAQQAVARGYGFANWPKLKFHVESVRRRGGAEFSSRPAQRDAAHDNARTTSDATIRNRQGHSRHPIEGVWVTRPTPSGAHRAAMDDMMMEFELIDGAVTLTQIVVDPAGRQSATKVTVQADGREHPSQFGRELMLQVSWTDARTLEMIFKNVAAIVSTWTYMVSADGQSLSVSTTGQTVSFGRV